MKRHTVRIRTGRASERRGERPDASASSRAKAIKERGNKLDITWLKDESLEDGGDLPDPQELATEAVTELEALVDDLREIIALVEKQEGVEA